MITPIPLPAITDGCVHKLRIPLGRSVGDNGCAYEVMDILALRLDADAAPAAWGYACATPVGYFKRTGWWITPTPSEDSLRGLWASRLLPHLRGARSLGEALAFDPSQAGFLKDALRMALWDLAAKAAGKSVAALLAGRRGAVPQTKVPCYGSTLDYPSTEADAQSLAAKYAGMGIGRIKVKVGAPDVRRDIRRLLAIREAAGEHVTLTADANEAWDAEICLRRLRDYEQAGIRLGYIEDPLPRGDWEGYALLRVQSPVPVAAHDYFTEIAQYERAAEARLYDFFRSGQDTAHQVRIAELGAHYGLPVYYGNSIMEQNIQAAAGLGCTVMIEFSDLAWWRLSGKPPRIEGGCEFVPQAPGFGNDPDPAAIIEFHHPEQSDTVSLPCPFPNE
ncbi:MAG: hypothetical protein MUE94_07525 [Verrucomicrobia bacterium]|jgi:L-alanine-DL-glutamate epimerase-like enolase superfamily enzyme|nr:hypothetical protein [Verrucomicrobiota bacterium]